MKFALDLPNSIKLTWRTGLFLNDTGSHAQTYLTDASGNHVFAGPVNIDGRSVTIPASAFSNQVYRFDERHWMHAATLEQSTDTFFWSLVGSLYDYAKDDQRIPSTALPAARTAEPGRSCAWAERSGGHSIFMGSRGQSTSHELHGGAHYDGFTLKSRRFATDNWIDGNAGALSQELRGKARTLALWAEDHWTLSPVFMLTLGARYEWWNAYGGRNFNAAPALDVINRAAPPQGLSPKASLRWQPIHRWSVTLSARSRAPLPHGKRALSGDLDWPDDYGPQPGSEARESEFRRARHGAYIARREAFGCRSSTKASRTRSSRSLRRSTIRRSCSTMSRISTASAPTAPNLPSRSATSCPRFDLSGSFTLADPKIVSDPVFPAAEGKMIPQVPRRKATIVGTWRPTDASR